MDVYSFFATLSAILAVAVLLATIFAPQIYDTLIVSMTMLWYRAVFDDLPMGARVLDIGIGTATALEKNSAIVKEKGLRIVGVDYDAVYIAHAKRTISTSSVLRSQVKVVCKSVFDRDLLDAVNSYSGVPPGTLFDAVYFSGSFSLLPEQAKALHIASQLLSPTGAIYVTQTFQRSPSRVLSLIKPFIKYFTTIDFGRLMLEDELESIFRAGGLRIDERRPILGSVNNALQTALLLICRPKQSATRANRDCH